MTHRSKPQSDNGDEAPTNIRQRTTTDPDAGKSKASNGSGSQHISSEVKQERLHQNLNRLIATIRLHPPA